MARYGGSAGNDQFCASGSNEEPAGGQHGDGAGDPFMNDRMPNLYRCADASGESGSTGTESTFAGGQFYRAAYVNDNPPTGYDFRNNPNYDFRAHIPELRQQQEMSRAAYYSGGPTNGADVIGSGWNSYIAPDAIQYADSESPATARQFGRYPNRTAQDAGYSSGRARPYYQGLD